MGKCSPAGGYHSAQDPPPKVSALATLVASLLLSRKTQIGYSLCDLMSRKLSLPNFCICFLPCKPSSSFLDGGQQGAWWGLCSCMGIRWWCLQGHVKPRHRRQKLCFHNSCNISAALSLGKGSSQHSWPQGLVAQSSVSLFYFLSLYFINLLPRLLSAD